MPDITEFTAPVQIVVDTEKLLDQIGWRKAGYASDGEDYEETGPVDLRRDLASEVAKALAPKLQDEMKAAVRAVVIEVARDQVAAVIDEVMTGGFRQTNAYGEPTGKSLTLRELVIDEIEGQLQRRVTRNGNRAETYDRDATPYVEFVARQAAQTALSGELKAAAAAAVDEIKSRVTAVVAEDLGAKIAKAVTR